MKGMLHLEKKRGTTRLSVYNVSCWSHFLWLFTTTCEEGHMSGLTAGGDAPHSFSTSLRHAFFEHLDSLIGLPDWRQEVVLVLICKAASGLEGKHSLYF